MLSSIVTAIVPSSSSVVAAFLLLGLRNAGTPLEIASTPVRAAQPDENARSEQEDQREAAEAAGEVLGSRQAEVRDSDLGQVAHRRTGRSRTIAMPMIDDHEAVGRDRERRARLADAAQVHRVMMNNVSRDRDDRLMALQGLDRGRRVLDAEEIDTATVRT